MTSPLIIDDPNGTSTVVVAGLRVARWHETFPGEFDPIPGTVVRAGTTFVTVDFDDHGVRRVKPQHLTTWSEPREATR